MTDLASYRGVMLCTRPGEALAAPKQTSLRFSAGLAHEPLGLMRENRAHTLEVAKPATLPALIEHKKVLQSIRTRLNADRSERESRLKKVERRMRIVRLFCAKQREAVRELIEKNNRNSSQLAEAVQVVKPSAETSEVVRQPLKKPEMVETPDALIDFAANLDFDKYMADLEFRTAMSVLKDRASAIEAEQTALFEALAEKINAEISEAAPQNKNNQHVQEDMVSENLGEDIGDSASQVPSFSGRAVAPKPVRASVEAASEGGASEGAASRVTVESLLKERRELRHVHSKESLKKVINSALAPLLVTSEDAIRANELLPQNLPYLYRSPSI